MEEFIVGRNAVREALRGSREIGRILVSQEQSGGSLGEIIHLAKEQHIEVRRVPSQKLNKYGDKLVHQGVIAFVNPVSYVDLYDAILSAGENPIFVLLDGIEDTHNMGAIIRTAECIGAKAVLIPKRHNAPINATVAKTSAGALEFVPLVQIGNVAQTLKTLKKAGFWIIGAHMEGAVTHYEADLNMPLVLVIGNEGKGLSRLTKDNCDLLIKIPMFGSVNSLNASVAAGVLMYEAVRQRGCK